MVNPYGGVRVTAQKAVVEKYTDGFRRSDLGQVFTFTDGLISRLDTLHVWLESAAR
jgi:hypothetical protein